VTAKTKEPEQPVEEATAAAVEADEVWNEDATIHERLGRILAELPAIGKDTRNADQGFMFRSHDTVLNELNPLLGKYGVIVVPEVLERIPGERMVGRDGGKTMYETNLRIQFTFYGPLGDSVVASAWGEGTDMGDKSTSKAITMAFKSVLAIVLAVSTAETVDPDGSSPEETIRAGQQQPRQQQPPGATRTRSAARGPFDPGKHMLDGAIPLDASYWQRMGEALKQIGPTLDWPATLQPLLAELFGVSLREELPEERRTEYATRMANAVARIVEKTDVGAFPPVESREPGAITEAFQWAFAAKEPPELRYDETEAIEAAEAAAAADTLPIDDVPFGPGPDGELPGTMR
jgi:hypothetical protein